jgi:hypothetical protein
MPLTLLAKLGRARAPFSPVFNLTATAAGSMASMAFTANRTQKVMYSFEHRMIYSVYTV